MIKKNLNFFKIALLGKYPGAVARSSPYVVKRVLKLIKGRPLNQVIEYGPGDGVMTLEILRHLPPNGKLLAVEINPEFLKMLRKVPDPRLQVIDAKIQDISQNINTYGFDKVDLVLASIPFSFLPKTEREKIVEATEKVLAERGMFIIFHQSYSIMAKPLKKTFGQVKIQFEPRNFMPCFIISATKSSGPL